MESPSYFRPVATCAAISSLIQSVIWMVLTLIGILAYACVLSYGKYEGPFDDFRFYLIQLYYHGESCDPLPSQIGANLSQYVDMDSQIVHDWMISYFSLNIVYFVISVMLLAYVCKSKKMKILFGILVAWCVFTLAFCVMDVWLTASFGQDVYNLKTKISDTMQPSLSWSVSIPVMMMVVSARGYIIWLANLGFAIYLTSHLFNYKEFFKTNKEPRHVNEDKGIINGFEDPKKADRPGDAVLLDALTLYKNELPRPHTDAHTHIDNKTTQTRMSYIKKDVSSIDIPWEQLHDPRYVTRAEVEPDSGFKAPVPPKFPAPIPEPRPPPPMQTNIPRNESNLSDSRLKQTETPVQKPGPSTPFKPLILDGESIIEAKKSLRKTEDRRRIPLSQYDDNRMNIRPAPSNVKEGTVEKVYPRNDNSNYDPKYFQKGQTSSLAEKPEPKQPKPFIPVPQSFVSRPPPKPYGKPILAASPPAITKSDKFYY